MTDASWRSEQPRDDVPERGADDGTPINHSQDTSGPAEPGAVKAWLCGDFSPDTGIGFVGPHEALTRGRRTGQADSGAGCL